MTFEQQCTAIADRVVPQYRDPPKGRSYSCSSHTAHKWQAAWDGACIAMGGDPFEHINPAPKKIERVEG